MQKINITSIVSAHLNTLRRDGKLVWADVALFYLAPILLGVAIAALKWEVPDKALELSISVFSIFAALLLSVQVAMYSVSLREILPPADQKKLKYFQELQAVRDSLIKELNSNISYLILLSVFTVTLTLLLFFVTAPRIYGSGVAVALYMHFFLTLLMVVKRASIVFSREYEDSKR